MQSTKAPLTRRKVDPLIRFWRFVEKQDGDDACWLWAGNGQANDGYGSFWLGGRQVPAHRASWMLNVGPIPDGFFVCHKCDVRRCVRPSHLWLGTCADNLRDMAEKGRSTKGVLRPPDTLAFGNRNGSRKYPERLRRGQDHPEAKLNDEQVREILRLRANGALIIQLARQFNVSKSLISLICRREAWRHLGAQ